MRYIYLFFLLLLAGVGSAQGPVIADTSFNGTGQSLFMINNSESSYGSEVLVLPDGKILMSGVYKNAGLFEISVVKLNSDGYSVDSTFGVNGVATAALGNTATTGGLVNRLKTDPTGRIFVSGYGYGQNYDLFLCSFLPNGTLDNSFDLDGRVFVNIMGPPFKPDQLLDFTFDAVGNIYLTGSTNAGFSPTANDLIIVKLTPSGALDPTFSTDGKQLYPLSSSWDYGYGIAVQPDGKIIVSGYTLTNSNFFTIRVNPDGTMDNTFGTNGKVTVDIFGVTSFDYAYYMLLQPDGKIVVGGTGTNPVSSSIDAAIIRLNQNGVLDNTFGGGDGIFTYDMSGIATNDAILKMKLLADGRILCSGYVTIAGQRDFALIRVNADGTLDSTFNNTGAYIHDLTGNLVNDDCTGIDIQPDGKIILGGKTAIIESVSTRYSIMRIIPDIIIPDFSALPTTVCSGNSVQFTDNTGSNILQWNWTFEGGTPATSNQQNPLVTYTIAGTYNVKLVVSSAYMTDSLSIDEMITVITTPAVPAVPSGPGAVCGSSTVVYSTIAVPLATSYNWILEPAEAGQLITDGLTVTFIASSSYIGPFTISVNAQNECGLSTYAQKTCQLNHAPSVYVLTGVGYYCQGTSGQTLSLSNSEIGVDYELTLNNLPTGNIIAGTGNPIGWNNITTEGFYMARANNGCLEGMAGQVYNMMFTLPAQAFSPIGLSEICNGSESIYTTSAVVSALSYLWTLNPANAGTVTANGLQASIVWNNSFSGTANLSVQAVNECGNGMSSPAFAITVNDTPKPEITGLTTVCQDWDADYETVATAGSTYVWTVTGGTLVSGTGTALVKVNWNTSGTGTIKVVETSASNCTGTSAIFNVAVDPCVGVNEASMVEPLSIYPNPAEGHITVKLSEIAGNNSQLRFVDATGRILASFALSNSTSLVEGIDISNLKSGMYTLLFIREGRVVSQTKVVKN